MHAHDLILLRHGETEWNRAYRMQGRLNSPLTEAGRAQADHLGTLLRAMDLTGYDLRCSPSGRALLTAGMALGHASQPIHSDARLMEIDIGAWSGLLRDEVRALRPDLFSDDPASRLAWYDAAPGGEGFAGLESRCRAVLAELQGPAVLVTHGVTLRMLRSLALCGTPAQFGEGPSIGQGVLYRVRDGAAEIIAEIDQISA